MPTCQARWSYWKEKSTLVTGLTNCSWIALESGSAGGNREIASPAKSTKNPRALFGTTIFAVINSPVCKRFSERDLTREQSVDGDGRPPTRPEPCRGSESHEHSWVQAHAEGKVKLRNLQITRT